MVYPENNVVNKTNNISKFFNILGSLRLIIILILIFTTFAILNPNYFSVNNFYTIFMSISVIGLACIGQTFCLLTGGFDLSVGSIALMSGVTAAYLIREFGINVWVAVLIVIIEGIFIGTLNGIIITKGRINPLIATLAMSSILTGLVFFLTEGSFVNVREQSFRFLGIYRLFGTKFLQMPIIILISMFIIFYIVLKYSLYGKYIYAIGGNKIAARFSGINVILIESSAYVMSGLMSALGGYIFASRVGAAQPSIGGNFALTSIAAVILGGVALSGGKGTIIGSFIGILIIQSLNIGLLGLGLETHYQQIATGLVLILAVFIDAFRRK
jgi:ribose transport system permease protein